MAVAEQTAGVPDGWEVVPPKAPATNQATAFGLPIKPEILAAADEATKRQAADAERAQNWPADVASKLPSSMQAPVGMGLGMIQPALEIASVLSAAPAALRAGRAATDLLSKPADALIDLLLKKIGHDPDALSLAATKMKLQAARSMTRQGRIAAGLAEQAAPEAAAPTAVAAPPAAAAPVAPVASAPGAPAAPVASVVRTAAPPPTSESAPSGPTNSMPDQKALNEAALARRRAEYQARVQAEAEAAAAAATPAKAKLSAAEAPEYMRLIKSGKTHQEAMEALQAARDFQARFGLTTPTAEDARFPKGQRGKVLPR